MIFETDRIYVKMYRARGVDSRRLASIGAPQGDSGALAKSGKAASVQLPARRLTPMTLEAAFLTTSNWNSNHLLDLCASRCNSPAMSSPARAGATSATGPSERTPLLASPGLRQEGPVPISEEDVLASEEIGEGGQEVPQFPELGKSISRAEAEHLVKFQKNGLLEGMPAWRFRCVFGGIVMGYFVSLIDRF